jgi:hypothetical protein
MVVNEHERVRKEAVVANRSTIPAFAEKEGGKPRKTCKEAVSLPRFEPNTNPERHLYTSLLGPTESLSHRVGLKDM